MGVAMPPLSLLLLAGGASFLILGSIGGFFLVPKVVASEIAKEKVLTPGSFSRRMFEKFPDPVYLKVYMWNVTNPMGVQKGEKPVLQEIGPFVYDEYKWKVKLKDRNMDDSVLFRPLSWFYYNQTLSGSLTGEEVVTIPNMLFLSIIMKVQLEMYPVLGLMDAPVMELFRQPTSIYINVKVKELLFDGITINCTVKEFMTKTVCSQMKAENRKEIVEVSPNIFKFSFFGARNGTEGDLMRVNRGSKDPEKVGLITEYKELTYLKTWRGSPCNNFSGSDGAGFPGGLQTTDVQSMFVPDLCRSLYLYYVKSDVYKEVPVYVYTSSLGDIYSNKTWHCFCRNKHPNSCPKKGSFDLNKCMGSPLILTLPHFYLASPEFLKESIGSKPDPELHKIHIELEPNTGTPLRVAVRFQFNIRIHNISRISIMKKLPRCMHPIMWIDQGILVPDEYVNIIKDQLLMALKLIDYGKWGMILAGLVMVVVGGTLHGQQKRAVTPVEHLMSFAPNTPEGQMNPAFEKDGYTKKWNGKEVREGHADLWINDRGGQDESLGRQDMGYMSVWKDRDRDQIAERPVGQRNRNDVWVNRERQEPQVIRNPEVEACMNREMRGEGLELQNDNILRDPEIEAWIKREVGGERWEARDYQDPRRERRVVRQGNPVARNADTETWIRETGVVDTHLRDSDVDTRINRETGEIVQGVVRDSNPISRINGETGGIVRGVIGGSNAGSRINGETGRIGQGVIMNPNVGSRMNRATGGIGRGVVRDYNAGLRINGETAGNGRGEARNSNVGAWVNRATEGTSQGQDLVRNSKVGSWMNGEERDRREPIEPRLMADVDDWVSRERQGDRWGPRDQDVDADPEMDAWMKRERAREGRATNQWQGRNWPTRRY